MGLIIFPAIDLRQGQVVRLRQGDPAAQTVYRRRSGRGRPPLGRPGRGVAARRESGRCLFGPRSRFFAPVGRSE